MSRFKILGAATAAVMGFALVGCTSVMPTMPSWMTPNGTTSKSSDVLMQSLRVESDPPGAEVRTLGGQTCKTPCELMVSSETQPVSIVKKGFVTQTVQVSVGDPPKHFFWEHPPPTLVPSPVQVVLTPLHQQPKQANIQ
jgi:hypothetical protein